MSIVPIIAMLELQYNDYLFACEKLQIDPSKIYEKSFIDQAVNNILSDANLNKKEQKKLEWFKKYYEKMEGGFFGNKFVSRAKKSMSKGKLTLNYEIKGEQYAKE